MNTTALTFEEFVRQADAELKAAYGITLEEGMVDLERLEAFHAEGSKPSDWIDYHARKCGLVPRREWTRGLL